MNDTVDAVTAWAGLGARQISTNGIELRVVEHGTGQLVVLCHGFPELGFSWRHQVFALAAAGYRTLTPDLRGYGGSSRPDAPTAYDLRTIGADLVGLLDAAGVDDAVFVGHDWGANVVWHLALQHPERVRAVAGLSVPPAPRPPHPPMQVLRSRFGEDFYMCWFQDPAVAEPVFERSVRASLSLDGWPVTGGPQAWLSMASRRPPWLTDRELDVFVKTFETTGFTGGLNYYRNIDRNWAQSGELAGLTIDQPSLFLTGSQDPVRSFMPATRISDMLTDLRANIVVDGAGHWIQQERPSEVNHALTGFLGSLPA
ncbi:alpha/beta fold hydrolase [Dactylosporangium sp. CA-233914]|uniref:alpha/beta fold hydrolase n=1 Tax=Dactylosporangium sp. CA-233914 TaxID=3239934 RepID=UPI003D91C19E